MRREGENMYCSECGEQISENAKFCPYCGQAQKENKTTQKSNNDYKQVLVNHSGEEKGSSLLKILENFGLADIEQPIAALCGEIIGLFMWLLIVILAPNTYGDPNLNFQTKAYYDSAKAGILALVGYFCIVWSFFAFRKYKKGHTLRGVGRLGYLVSIIVTIVPPIFLVICVSGAVFIAANR